MTEEMITRVRQDMSTGSQAARRNALASFMHGNSYCYNRLLLVVNVGRSKLRVLRLRNPSLTCLTTKRRRLWLTNRGFTVDVTCNARV